MNEPKFETREFKGKKYKIKIASVDDTINIENHLRQQKIDEFRKDAKAIDLDKNSIIRQVREIRRESIVPEARSMQGMIYQAWYLMGKYNDMNAQEVAEMTDIAEITDFMEFLYGPAESDRPIDRIAERISEGGDADDILDDIKDILNPASESETADENPMTAEAGVS